MYAWGSNKYGKLGVTTSLFGFVTKPVKVETAEEEFFTAVSCGKHHSLALTCSTSLTTCDIHRLASGKPYSWGWNAYGQLGVGSRLDRSTPTLVESHLKFNAISAGYYHNVALSGSIDEIPFI